MTLDQFINQNTQYIKQENSINDDFFVVIKNLFNKNKDFYKLIPDEKTLSNFYSLINEGDIDVSKLVDDDYSAMVSKDYWNREDQQSFIYTARILPNLRREYPKEYKKIFDGVRILPSGLDSASKKDPFKKTIWNIVAQAQASEKRTGKKSGGGGHKSFLNKSDAERAKEVAQDLKEINDNANFTTEQLKAVAEYVAKLLVGK